MNANDNSIIDVSLVPVSHYDLIFPGQIYLKRIYLPVILSQFIRNYNCSEYGIFGGFFNPDGLKEDTPFEFDAFSAKNNTYDLSYDEDEDYK